MAATQSLSVGTSWVLIPGTAPVVTVSPADTYTLTGGIRIATTATTGAAPSGGVTGHLLSDLGVAWSRGAGEGVWVRANGAGYAVNYTEAA